MPDNFCPECGGVLTFDVPSRRFACKSCGLFATREEVAELREKLKNREDDKRKKSRERGEYLEWWLSKK